MVPTVVSIGVVPIVLIILLILLKIYCFNLKKNDIYMETTNPKPSKVKTIIQPIFETLWSIGTSVAATVVVT